MSLCAAGLGAALLASGASWAVNLAAPPSLKTVPVPEPPNLADFVKNKGVAITLGKALFWDMQVGSDGVQACATCHFHAGADDRVKNQVSPGINAGDSTFQVVGPNGVLRATHFPFHKLVDPEDRFSPVVFDTNDVASSQGILNLAFDAVVLHQAAELGTTVPDPIFHVGGINTRRVEPRNAPTVINAVFNFANFWDGRANNVFNGVNPFGDADPDARVYVNKGGALQPVRVHIPNGSLASQAVGPPGSSFEMSYAGRIFPAIGAKLLSLRPLAKQMVHPQDSVLGPLSRAQLDAQGQLTGLRGLKTTYATLIRAAFQDKYWSSKQQVTIGADQFTQMQANFALFFGLAVQLYEATLVADDTPFDRFQEGDDTAMSASAQQGLNIFLTDAGEAGAVGGSCINCHGGTEFTNASVGHVGATNFGASLPEQLMERMAMGDGNGAFYDAGYYNIGVRPIEEDVGRGANDPFGYPLSFTDRALLVDNGTVLPFENPPLPCGIGQPVPCPQQRSATAGSFKAPGLRNIELTGPYFHNGGQATLMQVVDFYTRGGDFNERNIATLDPDIRLLTGLHRNPVAQIQLVDFLLALTDDRVRFEKAPFDHPELKIPNGSRGNARALNCPASGSCDAMLRLPAVGANGRTASGLPSIEPFLGLDPHMP